LISGIRFSYLRNIQTSLHMNMQQQPPTTDTQLIAIISYLTFIGWIIAFILYQNNKSELAIFHIRQSLGLHIIGLIGAIVFWIPVIGWAMGILLLVLWIMGLIYAAQGEAKAVPLIGDFIQDLFRSIQ